MENLIKISMHALYWNSIKYNFNAKFEDNTIKALKSLKKEYVTSNNIVASIKKDNFELIDINAEIELINSSYDIKKAIKEAIEAGKKSITINPRKVDTLKKQVKQAQAANDRYHELNLNAIKNSICLHELKTIHYSINEGSLKNYDLYTDELKELLNDRISELSEKDEKNNLIYIEDKYKEEILKELAPAIQDQEIEIIMNEEKNGIEIKFNCKPTQEIRENLKQNGFRWSKFNKVWYSKQSQEAINFANSLKASEVQEVKKIELLCDKQINKNTIENKINNFVKLFQNDRIKRNQDSFFHDIVTYKVRKKYILVDIGVSGRYMIDKESEIIYAINGYGKINKNKNFGTLDTIKKYYWGDFQGLKVKEEREIDFNNLLTIDSLKGSINEELKMVNTYKKQELKESAPEIKNNSISINDTTASEEIKNKIIANGLTYDLIDFKANIKNVENKNIFISCLYPSLNKNDCLIENKTEIKNSSYLASCKVIEIIDLKDNDYCYFKNNLLSDYAFLSKKGGYKEGHEAIILITCSNKETLVINPHGYSYARYVGQLVEIIEGDLLHEKNIIFSNGIIKEHENKIINTNLYKVKFNQENIIADTRIIHNDYINLTCVTGLTLKEFIKEGKYINFDLEIIGPDRIKYYLNALYNGDVVELFATKTNEIKKINFEDRLENELKRVSGDTAPPDHHKKNNSINDVEN